MEEIWNKVDFHALNQARFKLPSRTIAKIFVFKLLYGATAYGYAQDPDFTHISRNEKFWQGIIDEFYSKYKGIHKWHNGIIKTVQSTGKLVMPTGRIYQFQTYTQRDGSLKWPLTQIKNYPVQGLGADLVAIGRVALWRRVKREGIAPVLFQSTVHDSIDLDTTPELCYTICKMCKEAIADIPINFERLFKTKFNLPISAEVGYGPNLKDLKIYGD